MTETVQCAECGGHFDRPCGERWKRLCLACFKASRGSRPPSGMLTARERDEVFAEGEARGFSRGFEQGFAKSGVSPALVRRLITLTHPDRHPPERFREANEVTGLLLRLRAQLEVKR